MYKPKRKMLLSTERTPKLTRSPNSPLLNLLKLPSLSKLSSPQMSHRFFDSPVSQTISVSAERKITQSLYSLNFSKLAEEIVKKKPNDEKLNTETLYDSKNTEQSLQNLTKTSKNILFDSISEGNLENLTENNPNPEIQIIPETLEENIQEKVNGLSHKSSICVKDTEETLQIPVKITDKSCQKTIQIEKSVQTYTYIEDELEKFKTILKIEKEKYDELVYKHSKCAEKTKDLQETFAGSEGKLTEFVKLKKSHKQLIIQLDEAKENSELELAKFQERKKVFNEELALKTSEIERLNIMLEKSNTHKNRYAESINELESDILALKKENSKYKQIIETAKMETEACNSLLLQEKTKVELLENTIKELEVFKLINCNLEDQVSTLNNQNQLLVSENNETRSIFNKAKSDWSVKKQKMKDSIKALTWKIESENSNIKQKIIDAFRAKRSITLRDYDSSETFLKENILRMQQKIIDLESEVSDLKLHKEKLETSIDYCKNVISTKNTVINILEGQLAKATGPEAFKKFLIDSKFTLESISKALKDLKAHVKCCNCEQAADFSTSPCKHLLCSACQPLTENCPICSYSGSLFAVPSLKLVSDLSEHIFHSLEPLKIFVSITSNHS